MPLADRLARYEAILEMRERGMSDRDIGRTFDPPLTKQRVSMIRKGGPPRDPGRPSEA